MNNVEFKKTPEGNFFSFTGDDGTDSIFEYKPQIDGLWDNIKTDDFEVELLIHPSLNKESNVFSLTADVKRLEETVGYIFPISVLDTDTFEPVRLADNNYLFIAYQVLLQRLPKVGNTKSLGECFEDNICVMVLNRRTIGRNLDISSCIHSLRKLGYSYFVENNNLEPVKGYSYDDYKSLVDKRIHLEFMVPPLYSEPIIDDILRNLPKADNIVYRFILLYQVVEFLISRKISADIDNAIKNYQCSINQSENDFLEDIYSIRKERGIINELLKRSGITTSLSCYKSFCTSCEHLFCLCKYSPSKNIKEELFYSFRNQMIHSYRNLKQYKEELAHTIFHFERVVMAIIEKYPNN